MINNNNFELGSKRTAERCEFDFCRGCKFYPCEVVGEYVHFRNVHVNQVDAGSCSHPIIRAVAKSVDDPKKVSIAVSVASHSSVSAAVSYNQEEVKNGCMMSQRYVEQVKCGRQRVTEGIGNHYQVEVTHDFSIREGIEDRWEPSQPVFISAQTGQGKNYFIEHTLIPYVKEMNYRHRTKLKVLILSNRLALKRQIRNRLERCDDTDNEEREIYHLGDAADVITYHSLLHHEDFLVRKQRSEQSKYLFVICDEVHFFTSDAMFNPHTERILSTIVRVFKNAIRIYMSATPYDCLPYVLEQEKSNPQYNMMAFYHFKRDYEYLNVKTYSNIEELFHRIVESVHKESETRLIFIDDKVKCRTVKEKLEAYGQQKGCPMVAEKKGSEMELIFAANADSKTNPDYQDMVLAETLIGSTRVLITTSVLDNGVNLTGIDNIVVSDMSKTKVLQMVGRARVSGYERKTLYIQRFGVDDVLKRISSFQNQKDAYHRYELAYIGSGNPLLTKGYSKYLFLDRYYNGNYADWENAKHWFGRPMETPTELYLNGIAKSMVEKFIPQYQTILEEMNEESIEEWRSNRPGGQRYLEYQLSWFGKTFCEEDDITLSNKESAENEFISFLEGYAESVEQITKEKQVVFRAEFTKLFDAAFGRRDPNRGRIYGYDKMNKLLREEGIGYIITTLSSCWVVQRCD